MSGGEFREVAIPVEGSGRANSRWVPVVANLRRAAREGRALVWDCDKHEEGLARHSLYNHRHLRPGEKIHLSYRAGVLTAWMTTSPNGTQP